MTEKYRLFLDRIKVHEEHLQKEVKLAQELGGNHLTLIITKRRKLSMRMGRLLFLSLK